MSETDSNASRSNQIVTDEQYPTSVNDLYELMFDSDWFISFLERNQGIDGLRIGDWEPVGSDSHLLRRELHYTKPVSGPGPREVYCQETQEHLHRDNDDYILIKTITTTPDVIYGKSFHVVTTAHIAWAADRKDGCILNVTSEVIWTSWCPIKGLIEGRVLDGQRNYQHDLNEALREHLGSGPTSRPSTTKSKFMKTLRRASKAKHVKFDLPLSPTVGQIGKVERGLGIPDGEQVMTIPQETTARRRISQVVGVFLFSALITLLIVRLATN